MARASRLADRNGGADGRESVAGGHGGALAKDTNSDLDSRHTSRNLMSRPLLVSQMRLHKEIRVRRQRESLASETVEAMPEEERCRIRGETLGARGGSKRRHTSLKGYCSVAAAKRGFSIGPREEG